MKLTVQDKYYLNNNKLFLFSFCLFFVSLLLAIISMILMSSVNIESLIYIFSLAFLFPLMALAQDTHEYYERDCSQKIPYYIFCLSLLSLSFLIITTVKF